MSLLTDLEEFVHDHLSHGTLTCDATEPSVDTQNRPVVDT